MGKKILVSAMFLPILFCGCLFSGDSKENKIIGSWDSVTYKARYFENNDTLLSRQLNENEWKIVNQDSRWYSNIIFFKFEKNSFNMEHIDSSDSNSSKVESHDGVYEVEGNKLWLTFNGSPDGYGTSTSYPPLEIESNAINLHLCYKNYTGSGIIYVPYYGKCSSSGEPVPPKKSIEVTVTIRKGI